MASASRILVIKHSALGDVVLAVAAFQAIRRHHPGARITLLTTAPYVALGRASGLFDAVWTDPRAPLWKPGAWWPLLRALRGARFDMVYDLQRSQRTAWYFHALGPRRPCWNGTARGASHRVHGMAARRHIADRVAAQLAKAGIREVRESDLSFLDADTTRFGLSPPFALLVPGGAAHRPEKRWPAANFGELARYLQDAGLTPVILGTAGEADVAAAIREACPRARDLTGCTDFAELAALGRKAACAVGNDTGPMHLLAAAGCPSVALFGPASDPVKVAPRGPWVAVCQGTPLDALSVDAVRAALPPFGAAGPALASAPAASHVQGGATARPNR